jgi:hypothetical protein
LTQAAGMLQELDPSTARKAAREAAALAERTAEVPSRDMDFCAALASDSLAVAAVLCRLGEGFESLRLADQGRRLYAGLSRADPAVTAYAHGLSEAWERVGKARWALRRAEEALAAFHESAAVQRQAFARAPSGFARLRLSRCYDRIHFYSAQHGKRAAAAAALLEREKLWPGDAERLMEVARDFRQLADAADGAERERYLAESERAALTSRSRPPASRGSPSP